MSMHLRPSMLPKLLLCGHYRSDPESGEAAERGTKLDVAFRAIIGGGELHIDIDADADERRALSWAVATAVALSGGLPLLSDEAALRIECEGMEGTADLLCPDANWSADLKSGQIRDYEAQQAAYALGFMDAMFMDEWTVYLLFCDQEQVVTLRFTRDSARAIVLAALAKARDIAPPTPNEYCGWCALRFTCTARREAIGIIPFEGAEALRLEDQPSDKLREFALRAKVIEEYAKVAREILLKRTVGGEKTPGVSVVNKSGNRVLAANYIEPYIKQIGTAKIVALLGNVSEAKAIALFDGSGVEFPADKVEQLPGSSYVTVRRAKESKELKS